MATRRRTTTTRRRPARRRNPLTKAQVIAAIDADAGLAEVYIKGMMTTLARAYETAETDNAKDLLELASERLRAVRSIVAATYLLVSRAKFGG